MAVPVAKTGDLSIRSVIIAMVRPKLSVEPLMATGLASSAYFLC